MAAVCGAAGDVQQASTSDRPRPRSREDVWTCRQRQTGGRTRDAVPPVRRWAVRVKHVGSRYNPCILSGVCAARSTSRTHGRYVQRVTRQDLTPLARRAGASRGVAGSRAPRDTRPGPARPRVGDRRASRRPGRWRTDDRTAYATIRGGGAPDARERHARGIRITVRTSAQPLRTGSWQEAGIRSGVVICKVGSISTDDDAHIGIHDYDLKCI